MPLCSQSSANCPASLATRQCVTTKRLRADMASTHLVSFLTHNPVDEPTALGFHVRERDLSQPVEQLGSILQCLAILKKAFPRINAVNPYGKIPQVEIGRD